MSTGCLKGGMLLAYAEGILDDDAAESVASHIAGCPVCSRLLAELRAAGEAMRSAGTFDCPAEECPDWELVAAYADGSLSGADAAAAERHLAGCRACLRLLSDLWSPANAVADRVCREAEARALLALSRDARTAVIRWDRGVATLLKGFARTLGGSRSSWAGEELEPAFALARGAAPLTLRWSAPGGLLLECEIRQAAGRPALLGRLTKGGSAARAVSAMLRAGDSSRGPESGDAEGRFGPWPLTEGENELILTGAGLPDGRLELVLDVLRDG